MKDRELPIFPTAVFVATILLSLFIYIVQTPYMHAALVSQVVVDSNDTLWAVYKNRLIEIPADKLSGDGRRLSLHEHGIESHVGNLVALQDGGWLVNRGGQSNDLWSDIKVFFRVAEPAVKEGESSLLRCDTLLSECATWGDGVLQFDRAWSGIETSTGQFVINDVARHQIHLVSANGQLLDTLKGFRFPNQTVEIDPAFWVTDTNRNQLVEFMIRSDMLERTGKNLPLNEFTGIESDHRFPGRAARYAEAWWVMIHDNSMANAGIYQIRDRRNTAVRLGGDIKDAVDMVWLHGRLYLTDFMSNAVWYIDPDTYLSHKLDVAELDVAIEEDKRRAETVTRDTWWLIAKVMLVGVVALVFAIRKSKPVPFGRNRFQAIRINFDTQVEPVESTGEKILWIDKNEKVIRLLKFAPVVFILLCIPLPVISYYLFFADPELADKIIGDTHIMPLILALIAVIMCTLAFLIPRIVRLTRLRLGVLGNKLVFSPNSGKGIHIPAEELVYSGYGIYSRRTGYIVVQSQKHVFFDKDKFERYALPLVQKGTRLNSPALYWHRLKNGDGYAWTEIIFVGLLAGAVLAIQYFIK